VTQTAPQAPGVSILLLMKSHAAEARRLMPVLLAQEYAGPIEFIYMDSGSKDGTREYMASLGIAAHRIPPSEFHHGRTRNCAAEHATQPILVSISADALPQDTHWLAQLTAPFADPRVGAVYGRQFAPEGFDPLRRAALEAEYPREMQLRDPEHIAALHPGLFRFSNANGAVRRELWARFRWREDIPLAEDQGLCRDLFMAGYKIVYTPEAAVEHAHAHTLPGMFRYAYDNGVALTRLGILGNPAIGGEMQYGWRRLRQETAHWLRAGRPVLALRCLGIAMAKFLGVQCGKREHLLPAWMRRRFSYMQPIYEQNRREDAPDA
jgi:rhamnosyltransferase